MSWKTTPKNSYRQGRIADAIPVNKLGEEGDIELILENVIGTTTVSANGFDVTGGGDCFACCAGPAVILSRLDNQYKITQRLFRANPHVSPVHASQSFYNPEPTPSTPITSRHGSPFKDGVLRQGLIASSEHVPFPGSRKANNRSREATCVSLSQVGSFLAVGETGYNPRVLLFTTALDAPSDTPLSILTDHSFGVTSVAFSRDARWLCTLGNSYDGFVLIYSVNPKTGSARLHSSNKCSNVASILWMGLNVISIGTRHVKVWRLERASSPSPSIKRLDLDAHSMTIPGSPSPKTFSGRNCLLGPLINATFSHAIALSDCKAVLCTISGDLCLLDDTERTQRLEIITKFDFCIICITFDPKTKLLWVAGEGNILKSIEIDEASACIASLITSAPYCPIPDLPSELGRISDIMAIGVVCNGLVIVDSDRAISILQVQETGGRSTLIRINKRLPAHESAVLGARSLLPKAIPHSPDFLTFCAKGNVLFWTLNGTCIGSLKIALDQIIGGGNTISNELKALKPDSMNDCLVTGDKIGVLRLTNRLGSAVTATKAHNGDINDIAIATQENSAIVASCGRDRTIQVFRQSKFSLALLQTLDDHAASVTELMFSDGPSTLISISSDRTVSIRKLALGSQGTIAYVSIRVITLKTTPVSFTPGESQTIVLSTIDKQILKYDYSSGQLLHSFKTSDTTSSETVMLSSLRMYKGKERHIRLLLGISSTDRSIRIHDEDSGLALAKEYGQTAISAIELVQALGDYEDNIGHVISCGCDGTVMIWNLLLPKAGNKACSENLHILKSPTSQSPTPLQPLRRIMSRSEISSFQKSLESDYTTLAPLCHLSPPRTRRKPTRRSLATTPKSSTTQRPFTNNTLATSSVAKPDTRSAYKPPSRDSNPHDNTTARVKSPSMDLRRRSRSAAHHEDLNKVAEQICVSLRAFRRKIASAETVGLNQDIAQEMESELILTTRVIGERTRKHGLENQGIAGDLLDVYLANMIDERLALRAKSGDNMKAMTAYNSVQGDEHSAVTAGAESMPLGKG